MQKGFLIIWILAGILLGGVILFAAIKLKPLSTPPSQSNATPTPSQIDETADWKIYTNEHYRFTFKYPSEFLVNEGAAKNTVTIEKEYKSQTEAPAWPSFVYISTIPDNFTGGAGEIYIYVPKETTILLNMQVGETRVVTEGGYGTYKRLQDIVVDGISAKVFENNQPFETIKGTLERRVYVHKGKSTYMMGVIVSPEDSSFTLDDFYKIVGSFHFYSK